MCGIEPSYYGTHAPKEHAIASTPEYVTWQQLVPEQQARYRAHDCQALAARPPKAGQNNVMVLPFSQAIAHSRAKLRTGSNEK
jgi:hypothetical protein